MRPLTTYQFRRAPKRMTRGATRELMRFAFDAFCVSRMLCTVSAFRTLKTSAEKVTLADLYFTLLSTRRSRLWNFGRRLSPTCSLQTLGLPWPLARVGLRMPYGAG